MVVWVKRSMYIQAVLANVHEVAAIVYKAISTYMETGHLIMLLVRWLEAMLAIGVCNAHENSEVHKSHTYHRSPHQQNCYVTFAACEDTHKGTQNIVYC